MDESTNASSNKISELESGSHATDSIPKIKLPFPPVINPQDLISLRESPDGTQKLPSRAPNAFIIFRKQFVKAAREEGYFLPMTVISSMASEAWVAEGEEVKSEYRRIAREAHIKRKAMYPKSSNRRRRKDRWNIVSFKPTNSDSISAITCRIPNDQSHSQCENSNNKEIFLNSPSLNLENTSPVSSPEFSSDAGDSSPIVQSFIPGGFNYSMTDMTDNPVYVAWDTTPLPYDYCFEVDNNNVTLEDPTFGLHLSPNVYTSDDDSINSTSPYLDVEQFYINSTSIATNVNDENQSTMTPGLIREFNSIIESNIQQNDCYNDWQEFHCLQDVNFEATDSTIKSREEKLANEDAMWISKQLDMLMEGNCGDEMTVTENWFNFSSGLANGCFSEALGISA